MDFCYLIAQEIPLTSIPAPSNAIAAWWPFIMSLLAMAVTGISAWVAAAWRYREKQFDSDQEAESRRLTLEVEELKLQFDLRKSFNEQLTKQIQEQFRQNQEQITESRLLREELAKSRTEIWDRDKVIIELRSTITTMQGQIGKLEREVAELERLGAEKVK